MKKNTLTWFVVASATIALSGMGMAACSSSSSTGNPTGGGDSGSDKDGSSKDGTTGGDGGGGDSGGGDSGGSCTGSTPFIPEGGADNYCFSAGSCSGATPGCCDVFGSDGGFSTSCVATLGDCAGATSDGAGFFECQDNSSCGGQKCCISEYSDWDGSVFDNSCGKFYGGGGTHCAANCDTSAQICSGPADCTGGTTCKASKVGGKNFGVCL